LVMWTFAVMEEGVSHEIEYSVKKEVKEEDLEDIATVPVAEIKKKIKKTLDNLEITRKSQVYVPPEPAEPTEEPEEKKFTHIVLTIKPKETMFDVSIYEEIPKSVAQNVNQLIFHSQNYEVIEPDPLVMWTFAVMEEGVSHEIEYSVKKEVKEEDLEDIATVPVAEKIRSSILAFVLIPVIAFVIIFFSHFVKHHQEEGERIKRTGTLVSHMRKSGASEEKIKKSLSSIGYDEHTIKKVFR